MNTQKGFATLQISQEELITHLESCALCGEKLKFSHRTDFLRLEVSEEASCGTCGVRKLPSQFILQ
jgi:hypothetical protein